MKNISLIPYSCGAGAYNKTCADGPKALLEYGLANKLNNIGLSAEWHPAPALSFDEDEENLAIVAKYCTSIKQQVQDVFQEGRFPITIGGDHSMAIGTWAGVADALDIRHKLGLIWIDAHMDAHTATSSPTSNIHGMPISYLLGRGTDTLANITGKDSIIDPHCLCLIGVRSFELEEAALLDKMGATIFTTEEIEQKGLDYVMVEAIEIASRNTAGFGISIDIDVFDPEIAPGTGTLVENGFLQDKFTHAMRNALAVHRKNLLALEIAEYNPHLDKNDVTADLIKEIITAVLK